MVRGREREETIVMPVVGRKVTQSDIRLIRGDTERVGGRWRQRNLETSEVTPVDLHSWSGRLELWGPDMSELWYSRPCGEMTEDGYAICVIPAAAFTAAAWSAMRAGEWKIVVTSPDGATVRTIAWGHWTLSD